MGAQMMSGNDKQKEWIGYKDKDIHHIPFPYPWELKEKGDEFLRKSIEKLVSQGIDLDIQDVNKSAKYMSDMVTLTGQSKTPTFSFDDFVVADFDVSEFLAALKEYPQIRQRLGIKE